MAMKALIEEHCLDLAWPVWMTGDHLEQQGTSDETCDAKKLPALSVRRVRCRTAAMRHTSCREPCCVVLTLPVLIAGRRR